MYINFLFSLQTFNYMEYTLALFFGIDQGSTLFSLMTGK